MTKVVSRCCDCEELFRWQDLRKCHLYCPQCRDTGKRKRRKKRKKRRKCRPAQRPSGQDSKGEG